MSPSHALLATGALQAIFAVIIPVVTSTKLDGESCLLNVSGSVCNFAYATSGFSLLFSLLLLAGVVATLRARRTAVSGDPSTFIPSECGGVSAFAALWWVAAAATFTQRGKQASDAGLPEGAARSAVVAFSWIEFSLFVLAAAFVAFDRFRCAQQASRADAAKLLHDDEVASSANSQTHLTSSSQFKTATYEAPVLNASAGIAPAAPPAPLATAV